MVIVIGANGANGDGVVHWCHYVHHHWRQWREPQIVMTYDPFTQVSDISVLRNMNKKNTN